MNVLDRKLLRDLRRLVGQVLTIALVVACGIAAYVTVRGTYQSLTYSRDAYYERYRFGHVFARLERAPLSLRERLQSVPGVATVYLRQRHRLKVPLEGLDDPAGGEVLSLPVHEAPALNALHLTRGRLPAPGRTDETVLLESFSEAHGIEPGNRIPVILNGVQRRLHVVGIAMSPEYVFPIQPGEVFPDKRRFAVLWMPLPVVAAGFRMEGAFNDLVMRLQPAASQTAVVEDVNRLLEPYGGLGAHGRDRQLSHSVLKGELAGLQSMGTMVPLIFLAVAAFLVNVVLSRLVQLQRTQIAVLKALGYRDRTLALHYLKLVSVVVVLGSLVGAGVGLWLGDSLTELYTEYFRFPILEYRIDPRLFSTAVGVSVLAAVVGALLAAASVMRMPPAEAMRPAGPARYRRAFSERLGLTALFGQSLRMVLRELERRPARTLLSTLGIAMAIAVMIAGRFMYDSVDKMMEVSFQQAQREDLAVSFIGPAPERARRELTSLPGVLTGEGLRLVPVRLRAGHRSRETSLLGYPEDSSLRRAVDFDGRIHRPPIEGLMLSQQLAENLGVAPGDRIGVELLEGPRTHHSLRLVSTVDDVFGLTAYMRLDQLNALMREERLLSMAVLRVDARWLDDLRARLQDRPGVLGVTRRDRVIELFRNQTAEQMLTFTLILTFFASVIAIGVVYNNARVTLSTRARDMASLRVLGFRRREISAILLGELAIQVALAIVPGMVLGKLMAHGMMAGVDPDLYRFPVIVGTGTYAFAILVTLGAALVSGLLVRRKLDALDLIGVLKTRE